MHALKACHGLQPWLCSPLHLRPGKPVPCHSFALLPAGTACKQRRALGWGGWFQRTRRDLARKQAAHELAIGKACALAAPADRRPLQSCLAGIAPPLLHPRSGDVCNGYTRIGDKTYCRLNWVDVCTCPPPSTCGAGANAWCTEQVRRGASVLPCYSAGAALLVRRQLL